MSGKTKLALIALAFVFHPSISTSQENKKDLAETLGWDLTYRDLMKANKIEEKEYLATWFKETKREFTKRVLAEWSGETILTSALFEIPVFHASEHAVVWLIRTKENAHLWESVDSHRRQGIQKKELTVKQFDEAFKSISSWKQNERYQPKDAKDDWPQGYLGFTNLYSGKESRQLLLTMDDFFPDLKDLKELGRWYKMYEPFEKK